MRTKGITLCLMIGSASLIGMHSCKKADCKDTDIKTYMLSKAELNTIHYTGHDTAVFVKGNDTASYISFKRGQYFNTGSNPGICEGTNEKLEGAGIILKDSIHKDSIFHNQYVSFTDPTTSSIAIGYRGVNFLFDYRSLKIKPYLKDSLMLGGNIYNGVYIKTLPASQDSLYYNIENGIIRIVLSSQGKTLQLR